MPAQASKGPVAPASKKERSGSSTKEPKATALRGDLPPAKVLEHSDKAEAAATAAADTAAEDSSPNRDSQATPTAVRTLPSVDIPRGVRRESSVLMPTKPGESEVVLFDRLMDPLTNEVTEVLQPPLTEEEAEAALRATSTGKPEDDSPRD